MKASTRRVIFCVVALVILWVAWAEFVPYPRSRLPSSATEVHDYDTSGFIAIQSDYFYLLTAKISEDEFARFVADIGLAETNVNAEWWPKMNDLDWWTPKETTTKLYASTSKWSPNAIAKYEDGKLFYKEWSGY